MDYCSLGTLSSAKYVIIHVKNGTEVGDCESVFLRRCYTQ